MLYPWHLRYLNQRPQFSGPGIGDFDFLYPQRPENRIFDAQQLDLAVGAGPSAMEPDPGGIAQPPPGANWDPYNPRDLNSVTRAAMQQLGMDVSPPTEAELYDKAHSQATAAGLGRLGVELLAGAGTGDMAGSLARGLAAFGETRRARMTEHEQRARQAEQDRRQAAKDELDRRESEERLTSERQRRDITGETFERQQESWERDDEKRIKNAEAAAAMVTEIERDAGEDSPEARNARALLTLGRDVDLADLRSIHSSVIGRIHKKKDFDWETRAGIGRSQAEIEAGVRNDPRADDARADRGLAIQERSLEISAERARARGERRDQPTVEQVESDVRTETNARFQAWLRVRMQGVGEDAAYYKSNPKAKLEYMKTHGAPPKKSPPSEAELAQARARFEEEARAVVRSRYKTAPSMVMDFDENGDPL